MKQTPETRLENYDYYLPQELIAQEPLPQRDRSRLMLIDRKREAREHYYFYQLPALLQQGDVLVFNDSRVIPARLMGKREDTGGRVELLLLERLGEAVPGRERWRAMVRPGRKAQPGSRLVFPYGETRLTAEVAEIEGEGNRLVDFFSEEPVQNLLPHLGILPLPPYIKKYPGDPEAYQTVYSRVEGSVAAPTAGFHFTPRLLEELGNRGVECVYLTLHVGPGTFLPVKAQDITRHRMHGEYFYMPPPGAERINAARREGRRVIAVGTTSCRVLETVADERGYVVPGEGWTDLFIYPGFRFKVIGGLLTNFHLPRSTLLMLVCAYAGRELIMRVYREAVQEGYRFYSFGDATLIL